MFDNTNSIKESNIKYVITIKPNEFAERGFCYQCKVVGDVVIIYSDLSRYLPEELEVIPITQFKDEFMEMSKEDYNLYMEACYEGEDEELTKMRQKYLDLC